MAMRLSWTRSAPMSPLERSTHSSILSGLGTVIPAACRRFELVAGVALRDPVLDGLGVAAREPPRGPVGAGQIECFQNLHDVLVRLH